MELYKFRCSVLVKNGLALEELNNYENFKDLFSAEEFKKILNEKQKRKNKRYRTKNKFYELIRIAMCIKQDKKIVFGTITLDDYNLNQKEDTYIRKINAWLKKHFVYAILNKDFGSKTEREHYHFVGLTLEEVEDKKKKSKKGFEIYELKNKDYSMGHEPTLCLVNFEISEIQKIVDYLLKLNNHSNKITTRNRVRILKNYQAEMIILTNNLEPKKKLNKYKKEFYEKIKNPSYDTLNKRSVSGIELSADEFIKIIENGK